MSRYDVRFVSRATAPDDQYAYVVRRELSGGVNSRVYEQEISENQCVKMQNVSLDTPGKTSKRPGCVLIGDDNGTASIVALHNYEIQGAADQLLCYEDNNLNKSAAEGNWSELKGDFTAALTDVGMINAKMSGISPDDIVVVQNGTDNAFAFQSDGTELDLLDGATSPPITTVMEWYGNRIWCLKNDLLYWSDAYDSDYSTAFNRTTNSFRIPVGEERGIAPTRDTGMVIMGKQEIWGLAPKYVPDADDQPQPLVTNHGVVSKKGWCQAGDDIYYFAQDGFRSLKRTVQDKLQGVVSYPISYQLKTETESINWSYIENLQMEYFDNKVFIVVPTGATTTTLWIYSPAFNSIDTASGLAIRSMSKYKVAGEERLYIGKIGDGVVHRFWTGYTDYGTTGSNGTAIDYEIITRAEDLGSPLVNKSGGEVEVVFDAAGDYDVEVYASFDDSSYRLLGTVDLDTELVTFPTTFPVTFHDKTFATGKFHLDKYGEWTKVQLKISHNAVNSKDISLLRYTITSYLKEYEGEKK